MLLLFSQPIRVTLPGLGFKDAAWRYRWRAGNSSPSESPDSKWVSSTP